MIHEKFSLLRQMPNTYPTYYEIQVGRRLKNRVISDENKFGFP
jgi:hypothetical protein